MLKRNLLEHTKSDFPENDWLDSHLDSNANYSPGDVEPGLLFPEYSIPSRSKRYHRMPAILTTSPSLAMQGISDATTAAPTNPTELGSSAAVPTTTTQGCTSKALMLSMRDTTVQKPTESVSTQSVKCGVQSCSKQSVLVPRSYMSYNTTLQSWDIGSNVCALINCFKNNILVHIRQYDENGSPSVNGITLQPTSWDKFQTALNSVNFDDSNTSFIIDNSIVAFVECNMLSLHKTFKSMYARDYFSLRRAFIKLTELQVTNLKMIAKEISEMLNQIM